MTGVSTFETDTLRQPDAERRTSSKLVSVRQPGGAIHTTSDVVQLLVPNSGIIFLV